MRVISNRWVKGGNRLPLAYLEKHLPTFVDQYGQTYKLGRKMFGRYEIKKDNETIFWDADLTDQQFKNNQLKFI
jgi:hypothetical protein